MSLFSPEQVKALEEVKRGRNLFVTGPAGTGKSYLLKHIVQWAEKEGKSVAVTAMTGVAAILIEGQTFASFAGTAKMKQNGYPKWEDEEECAYWTNKWDTDLLIIDEISMMSPLEFQWMVKLKRDLSLRFQCILFGDFFQLPPVAPKSAPDSPSFAFETDEWKDFIDVCIQLKTVYRQQDKTFIENLNRIRTSDFTSETLDVFNKRNIYHSSYQNDKPVFEHKDLYTWIFPTRKEVDAHNYDMLRRLTGTIHEYVSEITFAKSTNKRNRDGTKIYEFSERKGDQKDNSVLGEPFLSSIHFLDDQVLHLREGGRVSLTFNLKTSAGLVNGAVGTILKFEPLMKFPKMVTPIVKFDNGVLYHINHHEWRYKTDSGYVSKKQLPLRHAYATTIHRSQGQTLPNAVMSLKKVFGDGQMYVALSRVKSLEDLHLLDNLEADKVRRKDTSVQKFYNLMS